MTPELKTLKSRFYVAKSQRLSDGLPWPYDSFDDWLERYMAQVPEGTDPVKCRTKYLDDGSFEVSPVRGGKGRRVSAKPAQPSKKRDVVRDAVEVGTYVAMVLEEAAEISLSDLDEAVEELLK
jgi:hypothetical protein